VLRTGTVRGPFSVGPRTVPVRSGLSGQKTPGFSKSASARPRAADGDRPQPGGSIEMCPAEVFQPLQARTNECILIFSLIPDYPFQQGPPQVGLPERLSVPARTRFAKRGAGKDQRPPRAEGLGQDERVFASPRQD